MAFDAFPEPSIKIEEANVQWTQGKSWAQIEVLKTESLKYLPPGEYSFPYDTFALYRPVDKRPVEHKSDRAILVEARALIEKGWTQYTFARDGRGNKVDWKSPDAVAFCAAGAIYRVAEDRALSALCILSQAMGYVPIPAFNDYPSRAKEDVLAAFDRAIAMA